MSTNAQAMTSDGRAAEEAAARAFAADALGRDAVVLSAIRRGGNARVWRVDGTHGKPLAALKRYPPPAADGRDRHAAEAAALRFLADRGEARIPRLLAGDPDRRLAILSFIPGDAGPRDHPTPGDMAQAIAFVERLHGYRRSPTAGALAMAAEACLSWREILRQVDARRVRLAEVAPEWPALGALLARLEAARDRLAPWADRRSGGEDLKRALWTLSPSDFGFHNAVRGADGALVFVDFEYFGWDDPAKLAVDLELHPAMRLDSQALELWHTRLAALYGGEDPGFAARVVVYRPLLALRWTCILLNEFLPELWRRRQAAGITGHLDAVLDRQLRKADCMLGRAISSGGEPA